MVPRVQAFRASWREVINRVVSSEDLSRRQINRKKRAGNRRTPVTKSVAAAAQWHN
jgi:hypothetical protein